MQALWVKQKDGKFKGKRSRLSLLSQLFGNPRGPFGEALRG